MSKFKLIFEDITADDKDIAVTALINGMSEEIKMPEGTDLIEINGMSVDHFTKALERHILPQDMKFEKTPISPMPGANLALHEPTTTFYISRNEM